VLMSMLCSQQPIKATLMSNLKSFDAKKKASVVELDWSTTDEAKLSYFVIQRSDDGRDFRDAAMIMSNANATGNTYHYSELLNQKAAGIVYYRLKMVDIHGKAKYSLTRPIRRAGVRIAPVAEPNPVTGELRIIIPANVHDSEKGAGQREGLAIGEMRSGLYTIRLKGAASSPVQEFAKR